MSLASGAQERSESLSAAPGFLSWEMGTGAWDTEQAGKP